MFLHFAFLLDTVLIDLDGLHEDFLKVLLVALNEGLQGIDFAGDVFGGLEVEVVETAARFVLFELLEKYRFILILGLRQFDRKLRNLYLLTIAEPIIALNVIEKGFPELLLPLGEVWIWGQRNHQV